MAKSVILISTPNCGKCKMLYQSLKSYCQRKDIPMEKIDYENLPENIQEDVVKSNHKSVPILYLITDEYNYVFGGDNAFLDLKQFLMDNK